MAIETAQARPQNWYRPFKQNLRKLPLIVLLPWLCACSVTSGSVYGGGTVKTGLVDPNQGPIQFASVSVPPRTAIIGRNPAYLTSLLGQPSLKRTEAGAELWQYQSSSCVALFYLYESESGLKVRHYDARVRTDRFGEVSEDLCMKEIVGTFSKSNRS